MSGKVVSKRFKWSMDFNLKYLFHFLKLKNFHIFFLAKIFYESINKS